MGGGLGATSLYVLKIKDYDMLNKTLRIAIFLFFNLFCFSCFFNPKATLDKSTNCSTTIEGLFSTPQIYKFPSPAILFNSNYKLRYKLADYIELKSEGVLLIEKKVGLLESPDTIFYNYKDIRAIVDANKLCVYGKLEENESKSITMKLKLLNIEQPEKEPLYIELESNKPFSYCIDSGNYKVENFIEYITWDEEYINNESFDFSFNVIYKHSNYLGDIKLLQYDQISDSSVGLSFYKHYQELDELAGWGSKHRIYFFEISQRDNYKSIFENRELTYSKVSFNNKNK
jgi:hypothetical protein